MSICRRRLCPIIGTCLPLLCNVCTQYIKSVLREQPRRLISPQPIFDGFLFFVTKGAMKCISRRWCAMWECTATPPTTTTTYVQQTTTTTAYAERCGLATEKSKDEPQLLNQSRQQQQHSRHTRVHVQQCAYYSSIHTSTHNRRPVIGYSWLQQQPWNPKHRQSRKLLLCGTAIGMQHVAQQ